MLLMCRGPWWPGLVSGTDSPHEEDRRDAGQRGDADGARRRAVVARNLGHDVNLERALVVLVADEHRDDDLARLARKPPYTRRNFFSSPSFLKFLPFGSKFSKLGSKLKSRRV